MNREQKTAVVDELAEQIRSAEAIIAVDYRGISVSQVADLRTKLRDAEARFRVVKNSLTERASDQAGTEMLKPMLEGPTALTFVSGDAAVAAKALNDAARALGTLEFKGALMNGSLLSAEDVRSLARLPSRDVMYAQLVGTIASPISGLVRTLNALISGLAIQLQQVAEHGLVSGEAPPPSEAPSASDTDGEAAASGASASDADDTPPETEAPAAAEPEAEASTEEPEAEASAEPEAEASPEPEATTETSDETETEAASDGEPSEAKEER
jgi:large subunit ribosomal protein L10